ncbi:MAG: diphosphate--fructose-6-phosphate 1-phosphotransferase [candidate division KSB1 bacterium]|nr:diphosphate--fructose-6-phosphate 1-phosphotransferase [candidate division KSB1 bacterium]
MMTSNNNGALGILVGGGPAPGINGVISAATIEAIESGLRVIGIHDGYKWLAKGNTDYVRELFIKDVSRIHFTGGSILRTSRVNPTKSKEGLKNTVEALKKLGIRYLVSIGGDDTAFAASQIARYSNNEIKIAHVPKTIDNDLPLPGNIPTFGFQTARHVGVQLVHNLMEDSRTTNRWYIAVTMGRKAGHLALGIAKAAGATLAIIGEEFQKDVISIQEVCDVLEGAMIKRRAMGREDGVVVLAEGIAEKLSEEELKNIPGVIIEYDDYGNIRLAEVELGKIIKLQIERRFAERGEKISLVEINIGYELRCAPPIPFDCEYVRDLGYSAVRYLLSNSKDTKESAMICVDAGKLVPIRFDELIDPATGKTRVRYVDINTESYAVAQEYMIKLKRSDFESPEQLALLAKTAKMSVESFRKKFGYLVGLKE